MRVVFIGCVEFSHALLGHILSQDLAMVCGVITRRTSPANADFRSLESLAEDAGCPVLLADDGGPDGVEEFIRDLAPQAVFCFGWSRLLGPAVLAIPPLGVIGYHPSLLPRNRGRHPLIWALALGLGETGSSFFRMDEGADSGPLLSQKRVAIGPDDDAATLYARMLSVAKGQVDEMVPALAAGTLSPQPQDHAQATWWRKRTVADGRIVWRMSAGAIRDLVRALTRPYPGAHCETATGNVRVWRAENGPAAEADVEPGRVLAIAGREILVKCHGGSIRLLDHEFASLPSVGDCL